MRGGASLNVLRRELRAGRKSFLGWTIPSALLLLLGMSAFPTISQGTIDINAMMKNLPTGLKAAFGLGALDMKTGVGYFALRSYLMTALIGGIYAALLGATILAKEQGDRTAEFLLTKPISRAQVVGQKAAAVVLYVLLYNAAAVVTALLSFWIFVPSDGYAVGDLFPLFVGQALITLTFGALGFLISTALRKTRGAIPLALGGVLGAFLLSTLSAVSESLRWLRWLSPFKYEDAVDIVLSGLPAWRSLALLGVAAASIALAFPLYQRKDIHA